MLDVKKCIMETIMSFVSFFSPGSEDFYFPSAVSSLREPCSKLHSTSIHLQKYFKCRLSCSASLDLKKKMYTSWLSLSDHPTQYSQ